ncbi:hypothetical protein [Isoptericola croceus]|uniref:hypothetical protein n=1 Tax=Isoptericola croceus TaxID=3031406 RepID=UPI0023F7F411|nr:hypothetical protein [Isoptericola croceus]
MLVALLPVLAVQALVWGVMMAWSARGPHDFPALPAHFLDLGVQLLALCALAGLGYAAGALLGPIAAGLAAAAAAFALLAGYVAVPGAMLRPFFVIGDGSPRLGFVPHLGFGGVQAVLLLVLACALFAVPGQVSRTKKAPWRAAACGALVIGCLVAPAWVDAGPYRMVTSNASDCRGSSPVVCDYAESAERRFVYEESVRTLVAAAREVGYDSLAPDHVHMVVDSSPPAGDAAMFTMTTQSFFDPHAPGTVAGIIDVAGVLITPRHCDQLYQDVWPPDAYWQATDTLMVTWLDLVGVDRSEIGMLDESIEPVGPHESAELVEALGSCDPSLLGPLP